VIGFGAPGQRESIKGGRDQDLHTPLYQTLALMACGAWVLMWLVFIALVIGSWLAFAISGIVFYVRWRRYERSLRWDIGNAILHVLVVVLLDGIWTTYIMTWTPWQKLIFTLLCLLMASPGVWFYYHITIRVGDPNYPSPRKAVEQREPQMPWYRDDDGEVLELAEPQEAQLVTLEIVEGDKRRYLTDIEITPGLQRFCKGVLDGSVTFSEGGAAGCEWKPKAAFIDLRDQMLEREMIAWKNTGNTRSGYHIRPVARRALAELAALPHPGG